MLFLIQWQRERHQLRHSGVPTRAGGRDRTAGAGGARQPPVAFASSLPCGSSHSLRGRSLEAIPSQRPCPRPPLGGSRRAAAALRPCCPLPRPGAGSGSVVRQLLLWGCVSGQGTKGAGLCKRVRAFWQKTAISMMETVPPRAPLRDSEKISLCPVTFSYCLSNWIRYTWGEVSQPQGFSNFTCLK